MYDFDEIDYCDHYYELENDSQMVSIWLESNNYYTGMYDVSIIVTHPKEITPTHSKNSVYLPLHRFIKNM